MDTRKELDRVREISVRDIIQPVSRAMLPKETIERMDEYFGHSDFFVVVPIGGDNVAIYPEGHPKYDAFCGATREQVLSLVAG